MRSNQLAARFWRDTVGSVLVEYAVVFPLFMLVALVTIDVTSMLYDWVQ